MPSTPTPVPPPAAPAPPDAAPEAARAATSPAIPVPARRASRATTVPVAVPVPVPAGRAPVPTGLVAAHALAHPTRRRIAEELGATPDGLSVAELSAATGLHHNAVREHLRTLAAAGVVASEQDAPQGRGRPTTRYSLVDEEAPRIAAHQELVRLLVGLLRDVGADEAQAERYGVGHGGAMADPGGRDALMAAFARSGFAPREISSAADARAGTLELRLEHCPFREAVLSPGGELVCALHRGLATGMAGVASPGARLTDFVPKDPRPAGCRVRVEGLSPPE